ncbi:hypothetical protein DFS34DRAFT_590040 [Phlyctochytrium arcticum]|nr:hypothetical protein DFS34DRAFT_590040 [Phlyctochytrium arcticum]
MDGRTGAPEVPTGLHWLGLLLLRFVQKRAQCLFEQTLWKTVLHVGDLSRLPSQNPLTEQKHPAMIPNNLLVSKAERSTIGHCHLSSKFTLKDHSHLVIYIRSAAFICLFLMSIQILGSHLTSP